MEKFYNQLGMANSFELENLMVEKKRLKSLYKKVDSLGDIKEFMNNDSRLVRETIFNNSIPTNKEVIQYMFVENNCLYNKEVVHQIIQYACENYNINILNIIKERHPDLLEKSDYNYFLNDCSTKEQNEIYKFMVENTKSFEKLNIVLHKFILTNLFNNSKLEKIKLLTTKNSLIEKEFVIENSSDLSLKGLNNLINYCELNNEQMKNLFIASCHEKGDCSNGKVNFEINNNFSLGELKEVENELGGYGNKLISIQYEYLKLNYKFDKETYQKAFDICIENENLETARDLLESNDFTPNTITILKIEKMYPQFNEYYKKYNLKQKIDSKLISKFKNKNLDKGLKI